jgi:glycosyltransferase involved in cell wall biosynthesis
VIVLDAAAVPDFWSGARTRLRGLVAAYGRLEGAAPLVVRVARGARLLEGVELGGARIEETQRPGGPLRRALLGRRRGAGARAGGATLWHSETIPPLGPSGVPAILTIHDLRWSEARAATGAPWATWAVRHLAARCWLPSLARSLAGVVAVSEAAARRIARRLKLPRERVHVVPNATILEPPPRLSAGAVAELLERLGVAERRFLLAVGHLEPRKGLELALAALASLASLARARGDGSLASARLVLVGAGPGETALRALASKLAIDERVVFAGALDESAKSALLERAAALVFPSRLEGFGFPVFEALAAGCPVIARDLDVLAEEDPGAVERLPEDVAAWAGAFERALAAASTARSPRPPLSPRERVDWSGAARRLAALYRSLGA